MFSFSSPRVLLLIVLAIASLTFGCGGGPNVTLPVGPATPSTSSFPQFGHVVLVVEENQSYSTVIGNPDMPYLNSLADQYGLATNSFGNVHPSLGNYFMLTVGQLIATDDSYSGTVTEDNVVRELVAAGKSWKVYAEDLPSVGYMAGDTGHYVQHHNPFVFFSDVNSGSLADNVVPFSQFATDLAAGQLPDYAFVIPNQVHNSHDGSLADADSWLQTNIDPLVQNSTFQTDGLMVITYDESDFADLENIGGHIATVIVSPKAKRGYQSTTFYQHQSTLRLTLEGLGVKTYPGEAANATEMGEFFQ